MCSPGSHSHVHWIIYWPALSYMYPSIPNLYPEDTTPHTNEMESEGQSWSLVVALKNCVQLQCQRVKPPPLREEERICVRKLVSKGNCCPCGLLLQKLQWKGPVLDLDRWRLIHWCLKEQIKRGEDLEKAKLGSCM